ncbi:RloB family protein [Streptomyces sp. NPDC005279]|uniref:RloB family protein n=1 Tax=Streptomyces sp. NPDC005279 TaxID=3364712 RepID=UPI0036B9295C
MRKPSARVRPREVYVFTEGEVTEPGYIDFVRNYGELKDPGRPFEIHFENARVPSKRRKPPQLVEDAVDCLARVERAARQAGLDKEKDWNWPQVWCFFDRDEHKDIGHAFARAQKAGVSIAYSHPCFELWRLLHYQDYTSRLGGVCDRAAALLKKQPGFAATYGGRGGSVSHGQEKHVKPEQFAAAARDQNRFEQAKRYATRLGGARPGVDPALWDPHTDVHNFVEDGLGVFKY